MGWKIALARASLSALYWLAGIALLHGPIVASLFGDTVNADLEIVGPPSRLLGVVLILGLVAGWAAILRLLDQRSRDGVPPTHD
jgi:hypothetical protein